METKRISIDSLIKGMNKRNENATPPKRFYLPFDEKKIAELITAKYKAEVLRRVSIANYRQDNAELKQNIEDAAKWLCSANKRPGFLMYGNVGTGKTTLLLAICSTINDVCARERDPDTGRVEKVLDEPRCISMLKAKQVISDFTLKRDRYDMMSKVALLAIDELGVEPMESKLYGNVSEPLIDLLCERYDRQLCTLLSTNMGLAEIRERYGVRLSDRFAEMFSMVPFTSASYRS
jgi:DNA replication protein DnaC